MAVRINIPPATRILLISQLTLSFLYNVARWRQLDVSATASQKSPIVPYLTLVPSLFYYYPWTLFTATFVEQNIFTVILNGATLFYGGKYLERAWGSREFGKFILAIALIPNTLIIPIYLFWAGVTGSSLRGLTQICGGVALQGSFLVAFKQLVPEHTVTILKGIIKMRVKHFPAIFLLVNTISGFIFGTDTAAVLSWLGLLTSWTYLRFYKRQPDLTGTSTNGLGLKGDASETFTFASFFPDAVQPPISFVADQIYALLVAMKVVTPFSAEDIASSNEHAIARGQAGLPSLLSNAGGNVRGMAKREEAERRRALALRALDQRLQAATGGKSQAAPNHPSPASSQTTAPTVPLGQSMLGETSYTPDHS
ncbi:putative rhomboid family protein [Talaromyces proteolyticus]|uniref:Rhomboid family protein n=1 Tax=Talaromyces proteolyticus TaxID=1131652 RepID=A0AAD4KWN0_9EURO|nr:putative rhomboid family protein [Talaromyces proteolyticus]KAH8701680.1 putative rhomboid family protein [Talaromyces proteolyticus]